MMCVYLSSRSPCMHTRTEFRENGDELVMKSPVTYLWQLGDDRCGATFHIGLRESPYAFKRRWLYLVF